MKLFVDGGKRKGVEPVELADGATVSELLTKYQTAQRVHPHRQAYKFKKSPSSEKFERFSIVQAHKTLSDVGVADGMTVFVKDVGPQFSYRGVFFWEYFGPLAIMLFFASRPAFIYGAGKGSGELKFSAWLGVGAWVFHYGKRLFETFFVHRFSRPTMPLSNLFKNCSYYWTFAAVIAYSLCSPDYTEASKLEVQVGFAMFALSEAMNFAVHVYLRSIRPPTDTSRRMPPTGILFSLVTSPNYTAEIFAWIGFAIMVRVLSVYVFAFVGMLQMTQWALGKYRNYLKTDRAYAKARKAIIPFVL